MIKTIGHKALLICTICVAIVLSFISSSQAACTTVGLGTKPEGFAFFNADENVMQYCAGTVWKAMGRAPLDADSLNLGLLGYWKLDDTSGAFTESLAIGCLGIQLA